jgi:SAM-dependent methyltransferase
MDSPAASRREHWDTVYSARAEDQLSWYQADPRLSLELVAAAADTIAGKDTAVLDAGGGASPLAGLLARAGYTDVTVADISPAALAAARARPGGDRVTWTEADLLAWRPPRAYQVWHDRAVFHFLTSAAARAAYLAALRAALPDGGAVILATFAADGPRHCSGLPAARYTPDSLASELTTAYGSAVTITGQQTEHHHTPAHAVQPFTWLTARLSPVPPASG